LGLRVLNRERLLRQVPGGGPLLDAYEAALAAVHPSRLLPRLVRPLGGGCLELADGGRLCGSGVYVAGFGKAARSMAEAVHELLGDAVEAGVVIAPRGMGGRVGPIEVLEGDHPVPGGATLRSSLRLLEFLQEVPRDALLLVLVSGGGSALFEVPAPGLELEDIAEATGLLMAAGADIYELNAVRKHLSAVKGGQLLRHTRARPVLGLYMSDVPGDRLDTIASGPTVPDPTTYMDAYDALNSHGLWGRVPERVRERILAGLRGEAPETPKPGDPVFQGTANALSGRNRDALMAAAKKLQAAGYHPLVLTDTLRGEAREAAKAVASILESMAQGPLAEKGYTALVAGGETTVTVEGRGRGGRSQELCLSLALGLNRLRLVERYAALCAGTDGVDGNSPAAGAVVDQDTIPRARELGLDPRRFLEENDSYSFFQRLGQWLNTGGYTGVNVNDIIVAVIEK